MAAFGGAALVGSCPEEDAEEVFLVEDTPTPEVVLVGRKVAAPVPDVAPVEPVVGAPTPEVVEVDPGLPPRFPGCAEELAYCLAKMDDRSVSTSADGCGLRRSSSRAVLAPRHPKQAKRVTLFDSPH